jgi:hypothetical protein
MDDNRFDTFVLVLNRVVPRRVALAGVLGTALAGLLTRLGVETAASRKRKRKKCKGDKKKCGKKCILKTACCGGCAAGETCCDGTCRDLAADGANCGACGRVCASATCIHGACGCADGGACPALCDCRTSVEGELACTAKPGEPFVECENDDDCPLGANCFDAAVGTICSGVCQG